MCVKFLLNVACQKLLKSASVSRSYWKNKSGMFLWTAVSRVILFLHGSIASSNNKKYLTAVFKYATTHSVLAAASKWCHISSMSAHWLSFLVDSRLCRGRFCHLASQDQRSLKEDDFSHIKNFFQSILLKTTWLYDVRLQNYGVINLVPFFGPPCTFLHLPRPCHCAYHI